MLKAHRKQKINDFSIDKNLAAIILLAMLFLVGLGIAGKYGFAGAAAYLALWGISYPIIYAGTCRYCVYYGKKCPIPLEGSCVSRFFGKKDSGFGWIQLLWATFVYLLRIFVPAVIIIHDSMFVWGLAYAGVLILFWIVHLRMTGCPNCVNTECPLNPDHISND